MKKSVYHEPETKSAYCCIDTQTRTSKAEREIAEREIAEREIAERGTQTIALNRCNDTNTHALQYLA